MSSSPFRQRGFTLIELMVVVALIAVGAASISLAMRDPAAARLEREAARLAALLEAARAESRVSGITVTWIPLSANEPGSSGANGNTNANPTERVDFRFVGLPPSSAMPTHWLGPDLVAEVAGAKGLVLGPEPLIGPQRVTLRLDKEQITLQTDGLTPFAVVDPSTPLEAR